MACSLSRQDCKLSQSEHLQALQLKAHMNSQPQHLSTGTKSRLPTRTLNIFMAGCDTKSASHPLHQPRPTSTPNSHKRLPKPNSLPLPTEVDTESPATCASNVSADILETL